MKALVLAPHPFFKPRGTPFSVYYRADVLSGLGVEQDILTYGEGDDVVIPNARIIRTPELAFLGPVPIGPSFKKAVLDVFMIVQTLWLLLRNRYDFVHAHEEAAFWAMMLKPVFRYKLLYDMHSSLPEQLTNFAFSRSKLLQALFARLERASLDSANAVISICPALAHQAESMLGSNREKHELIENSIFDPVRLRHAQAESEIPSEIRKLIDDPSIRTIVYAGTLEHYQGIEDLIRGFAQADLERVQLVIAGGSAAQVEHYAAMAESLGLGPRCHFLGMVPTHVARYLNSHAAVLVSPRSTGNNTPLKVYEQMASGVPLVATNIYSHTQVLDSEVACLVDPTPKGIAEGLRTVLSDDELRKRLVASAADRYEKLYSRQVYERKLARVLDTIRGHAHS